MSTTVDANLARKSLLRPILKIFPLHACEEIPAGPRRVSDAHAALVQPGSLGRGRTYLPALARALSKTSECCQNPSCTLVVMLAFGQFARQRDSESQSVLPVPQFGAPDQPVPVHVNVGQCQPWQSFSHPRVKVGAGLVPQAGLRQGSAVFSFEDRRIPDNERTQVRAQSRRCGDTAVLGVPIAAYAPTVNPVFGVTGNRRILCIAFVLGTCQCFPSQKFLHCRRS